MDLAEFALSETDRILKRLGVTHVWREAPEKAAIAAPVAEGVAAEPSSEPSTPVPPLPALLRSLFHGKQPPVATLWSYPELYDDLQAVTAPPRLELFRKIQNAACIKGGWSDADICVWPIISAPHIRDAGLAFFQPKLLVFFGTLPVDGGRMTAQDFRLHGLPVRGLASLDSMVEGDQAAKSATWDVLKNMNPRRPSESR